MANARRRGRAASPGRGGALLLDSAGRSANEVLAGVTLVALSLPITIGYASVIGLPPTTGVYASIVPLLVFAVTTGSRRLVFSPDATIAALLAAALPPVVAMGVEPTVAALGAALPTGLFLLLAWLLQLGGLGRAILPDGTGVVDAASYSLHAGYGRWVLLVRIRVTVAGIGLAMLAGACGPTGGVTVEPLAGGSAGDVLSSCEPAGEQETTTLVEASGELPSVATMQQAVAGNPDAEFMVEQRQAAGASGEEALHEMYAQAIGQELFTDVQQLPGFVTGAYARPDAGEPFQLSFAGPVPDEFDADAYDLGSFGLEVTSGAAGFDPEAFAAAIDAAREVGMQPVSGSGDETAGTGRIEVIDATPDQVSAWERAVDDPSRWCLVRAPRTVPCDDAVIADARERADRQGEVLPNLQGGGEPTAQRAEVVRRSYLGLTLEHAEDKAAQEDRTVRVMTQDGVQLGSDDDLQPGRLSLTICNGNVVDTRMDLEPEG